MSYPIEEKNNTNRDKINIFLSRLATLEPGVSDIHLATGCVPIIRSQGKLKRVGEKRVTLPEMEMIIETVIPSDTVREELRKRTRHEYDFSYGIPGSTRFRVNLFFQRNHPALVMRQISSKIPSLDQLSLPGVLKTICKHERGLVLVTGVTGAGKSSTLAAMIDLINTTETKNIITIEDPIEFIHQDKASAIRQREIGSDTSSFSNALRAAMRQDPDVILVGEMRDAETIEIALRAAETGHLVFSTLHTTSAATTINRIIDVFEPFQQQQIRFQLAESLQAVISQRLLPKRGGGRIAAIEIMMATNRIRDYIANPAKTGLIYDAMEEGRVQYGMQSFDQHLQELFAQGKIELETTLRSSTRPSDLVLRLRAAGHRVDVDLASLMNESKDESSSGEMML